MFEAPEKGISKPGDVYSLSLIIVCILVHTVPKNREQLNKMQLAVLTQSKISKTESFSKLLKRGLSKNPEERPGTALYENTFDLGIGEQAFRTERGDRTSDEVLKIIVMAITIAMVSAFACYAPSLNDILSKFATKPDLDHE